VAGNSLNIDISGVFIEIGLIPNSSFAEGILEMNDKTIQEQKRIYEEIKRNLEM